MNIPTSLFPFPHYFFGERRPGSILDWPKLCIKCTSLDCVKVGDSSLCICPYGYNFYRVNKDITVFGLLVRDFKQHNPARNKRISEEKDSLVSQHMVEKAISILLLQTSEPHEALEKEKANKIREFIENPKFADTLLNILKQDIQRSFSFVHDYKQINTSIRHNINVIIETKYEGDSFEKKLESAAREERAIYESSRFLDEKLSLSRVLMNPEWLDKKELCSSFRFHGLVKKYLHIYNPLFEAKKVNVKIEGESYYEIEANSSAVAVIPHTLIDNAIKYSPNNGKIIIITNDISCAVKFSIASFGPEISHEEKEQIFGLFQRGREAIKDEEDGTGYGLYICQLVASRHLGTKVTVVQDQNQVYSGKFLTTFEIIIPKKAHILGFVPSIVDNGNSCS